MGSASILMAMLIHAGTGEPHTEAWERALYYAAHPRDITFEHVQAETTAILKLVDCIELDTLRQCTYMPDGDGAQPGIASVTISASRAGAPRGGFIAWRLPPRPCITAEAVASAVGGPGVPPALPPTYYSPPGSPAATAPNPDFLFYRAHEWDAAVSLLTISTRCVDRLELKAQLPQ